MLDIFAVWVYTVTVDISTAERTWTTYSKILLSTY